MKILALSGANERLLAAVEHEGLYYRGQGLPHNEHIVSLCQAVLSEAGLQPPDLKALAIDLGPGSFTGQRVSLSFAKGLSFALGKPLLGFDTFELWRHNFRKYYGDFPLLVVIDGRKRRFYAQLCATSGLTWDLSCADLCRELRGRCGAGLWITGPGAPLFRAELGDILPEEWQNLAFCPPPAEAALAASMLELAWREYQERRFLAASAGPLYLRKSAAEERQNSQAPIKPQ